MSHRAALYTVRVRERYAARDDYRLLGNIDGRGTSVLTALAQYLTDFTSTNDSGSMTLRSEAPVIDADELLLSLSHGESGLATNIVNPRGDLQYQRTPPDTELMRCYGLFTLPLAERQGWLALHVNHGRGVKSLLEQGLIARWREGLPDLVLHLTPFVNTAVVEEAINQNRIGNVRLIKYTKPNDPAVAATTPWVRAGQDVRIEVKMSPRTRGQRFLGRPIRRYLEAEEAHEKEAIFREIVEFEGLDFDEVKVEIVFSDNTRRSYNLEKPSSGHPMTLELEELDEGDDGAPTEESVLNALRAALATVQ